MTDIKQKSTIEKLNIQCIINKLLQKPYNLTLHHSNLLNDLYSTGYQANPDFSSNTNNNIIKTSKVSYYFAHTSQKTGKADIELAITKHCINKSDSYGLILYNDAAELPQNDLKELFLLCKDYFREYHNESLKRFARREI